MNNNYEKLLPAGVHFRLSFYNLGKVIEKTIEEKTGLKLENNEQFFIEYDESNDVFLTFDLKLDEIEKIEEIYGVFDKWEILYKILQDAFGIHVNETKVQPINDDCNDDYLLIVFNYKSFLKKQNEVENIKVNRRKVWQN